MSVYRRYFRVTSGPLLDAVAVIERQREYAAHQIKLLQNEIGASDTLIRSSGAIYGFTFDGTPDGTIWKRLRSPYYYPKQSTKEGRDLAKRIKAIPKYPPRGNALKAAGLNADFPVLIDGRLGHYVELSGSHMLGVWFVSVPWLDEDPAEIEQYRKDKAAGVRGSMMLDHLLWEPPAEFVEVKRWQVEKEIDEISAALAAPAA